MAEIRKRICFHGSVQGVGFRYRALRLAKSLGLSGWVRNAYDGTVQMEVQGSPLMIGRLLEAISREPYIRIDWIDAEEISPEEERSFRVLY